MEQGTQVRHKLSGQVGIIISSSTNKNGTWHNVRFYNKKTDVLTLVEHNEVELEVVDAKI